jgi:glutathione gamma-glutamylcysteinyltransferase
MESLYRRPLPDTLIAFASEQGRALFREALAAGTMESYFPLAEQHHTQADPAFCGLGSLVMVLNALAIDPGRLWRGPWRWFSEELLDCCVPLEVVRNAGLTLDEVGCLARCNGAKVAVMRAGQVSEAELRAAIVRSSRSVGGPFLIASYLRHVLGQTGLGHFSPIAGYHPERDVALLLDVARFKYPPHWVPVSQLFAAMLPLDPATGKSRGVLELTRAQVPINLALVFTRHGDGWRAIANYVTTTVPHVLREHSPRSAHEALVTVLAAAGDVVDGISLRTSVEPPHRAAVERVLDELRASAVFETAGRALPGRSPELATTLLYMIDPRVWDLTPDSVRAELHVLLDVERLPPALADDIRMLRQQLAALLACSPATPCFLP